MQKPFKLGIVTMVELVGVLLLRKAGNNRKEQYGECKKKSQAHG
jgi:hypothetical protein